MGKIHKRILQVLALSLLMMIQFLSIQAEKEDSVQQISQPTHYIAQSSTIKSKQYTYNRRYNRHKHKQHHKRKIHSVKHVTIKFNTTEKQELATKPDFFNNAHHFSYSEQYNYIYYKDINPPPPKV